MDTNRDASDDHEQCQKRISLCGRECFPEECQEIERTERRAKVSGVHLLVAALKSVLQCVTFFRMQECSCCFIFL